MKTKAGQEGPIYGVKLLDSLPLGKGGFSQAMPSQADLIDCRKKMKLDRVVAGFEVLTSHFVYTRTAAIELIEALRELVDHQNGCPLPKYIDEKAWNAAMSRAEELFAKYENEFTAKPQSPVV